MHPDGPDHTLYNLGVRGDGVAQVLERLVVEYQSRGELRNRVPDRIILSVGVNDSARLGKPDGRNFTPFEQFDQTLAKLLDQAQALCPVWFVGMVPVNPQQMPFLDCLYYNHPDQYRYKEATRRACEQRQIPYLDLFDLWRSRGEYWCNYRLGKDGLHPNILGYQSILQDVMDWNLFCPVLV
jgi:lysophospholipase L1-like esterase